MKHLVDHINEQLVIEGKEQTIVFFDHDTPKRTFIYKGSVSKAIQLIQKSDYEWVSVEEKGDILLISHSDEWGSVSAYPNLAKFKSENIKLIKKSLEEGEDTPYIETTFTDFEADYQDMEEVLKMSDAQLYKHFVEDFIEDSYIDGDSSTGYTLVDIKNEKNIIGSMKILFYNDEDVLKMFK